MFIGGGLVILSFPVALGRTPEGIARPASGVLFLGSGSLAPTAREQTGLRFRRFEGAGHLHMRKRLPVVMIFGGVAESAAGSARC
jgi:hypothetical protein